METTLVEESTSNDEAIARAIAESDERERSHALINNNSNNTNSDVVLLNCPGRHGLQRYIASNSQRVSCNGCHKTIRPGGGVWSCVECDYDSCESCFANATSLPSPPIFSHPPLPMMSDQQQQFYNTPPSSHMCLISCTIGDITVEMLVDTGAQSSVISSPLVRQLGLSNRLDRRYQGIAAGVGRARISGRIRNVVCSFGDGNVEFLMDFIVLDINEHLVIMGLDQMRKYKCLVDVGNDKLIFGGVGGVEVNMLPAHQTRFDMNAFDRGCAMM